MISSYFGKSYPLFTSPSVGFLCSITSASLLFSLESSFICNKYSKGSSFNYNSPKNWVNANLEGQGKDWRGAGMEGCGYVGVTAVGSGYLDLKCLKRM